MLRSNIFRILFCLVIVSALLPPQAVSLARPTASVQEPHLVKDINAALTDSSNPNTFMPSGSVTYFSASRGQGQPALWKTDGTAAGTELVKEGIQTGDTSFATYHGLLYFAASTQETGVELWRTNGTTAGTELFKDIDPGTYSSDPEYLTVFEDLLYFGADMGRFCISDGTPTGTIRNGGLAIRSRMLEFKGSLYFSAYAPDYLGNNDQYYLAWFGPGGSGQTTDLTPGNPLIIYKDRMYFTASRADVGEELWSTGGTLDSISLLKDINPAGDAHVTDPVEYNGLLYFAAQDAEFGPRLWQSDGSTSGTIPVFDPSDTMTQVAIRGAIQPGGDGHPGGVLVELSDASWNRELWTADGTPAGTHKLADLEKGTYSSGTVFNNEYIFSAYDAEHGLELWRTDGTPAGTNQIADLRPGLRGSNPNSFAPCGTRLCFSAEDGIHGMELWSTDGTAQGTGMVADLNTLPANSNPNHFVQAQNLVYFFASDAVSDSNLWRTDGTPQGTLALNLDPTVTMQTDWFYYDPPSAVLGDTLFFPASDPTHGTELWKSDGTPEGTGLVKDIWPGAESSSLRLMMVAGNRLFFFASTPQDGEQPWISDGTAEGTKQVAVIVPNTTGTYVPNAAVLGNSVVFSIVHSEFGSDIFSCELWKSDGTLASTGRISDHLCSGGGKDSSAVFQGKLYFSGIQNKYDNPTLWETDGSTAGTRPVPLQSDGFTPFSLSHFTVTSHGLYFFGTTNEGFSFFNLLPDKSGAEIVYTFYNLNGAYTMLNNVTSFGDNIALTYYGYASEVDGAATQLWISDGSQAGTRRIKGDFSRPANLVVSGGRLYFTAPDPISGVQLWRTDGTNAGTGRASNYMQTSCMVDMMAIKPDAFLLALNDNQSNPPGTGCELWYYDTLPQKVFLPTIRR